MVAFLYLYYQWMVRPRGGAWVALMDLRSPSLMVVFVLYVL